MENKVETTPWSWMRAHWKALLVISLVSAVSLVGTIFWALGNSEVVKLAMTTAASNPRMIERLGQPLQKGWLVSGNMETNPASGHAELAIPLSGPKGSGTLYVDAEKRAGLWHLGMLQFGSKGSNERLDLLATDTPPSTTTH